MSVVVQYVVRPNPGNDPAKITELAKEGAVLWRKHGGKVTYWTVAVGEVGNRVLSITFENFAAYGAAVDKMGEDKEGGLNRSPQHFILEGKDGVWDGTEIS